MADGKPFDPTPHLRQLRGRGGQGQDYLDVKFRLLWLRKEHPDAVIETEHIELTGARAIFRATARLPTGGIATGYGSETPEDFGDYIEKAETKAIGRALNALGYGAQYLDTSDDGAALDGPCSVETNRAIHGAATERGFDHDAVSFASAALTGVGSMANLTEAQGQRVRDTFARMGPAEQKDFAWIHGAKDLATLEQAGEAIRAGKRSTELLVKAGQRKRQALTAGS